MIENVKQIASSLRDKTISLRRDFHRYPESGWTEFRTASLVARHLAELGYIVQTGPQVLTPEARMGLPAEDSLQRHYARAAQQGADAEYLPQLRGGMTAVVGLFPNGKGPTVAVRFDMDALDLEESDADSHRPVRAGFVSVNQGVTHACGHDCHTAVGLVLAEAMAELRHRFSGTLKLIFQPAEEGVRGARAMVEAGVVDDVDFLLGHHLYSGWKVGEIGCGMGGYFATRKFDAFIEGRPAHAGGRPHDGRNALVAASAAILGLYGIARHSGGATRVNVGRVEAGTGRNIIASHARLTVETRGATNALSDYMYEEATRILAAAADMQGCSLKLVPTGEAQSAASDAELAGRVRRVAEQIGDFSFLPAEGKGGSEDFTCLMDRVQRRGGQATYIGVGADYHGISHDEAEQSGARVLRSHTAVFDVDESAFETALSLFCVTLLNIMPNQPDRKG